VAGLHLDESVDGVLFRLPVKIDEDKMWASFNSQSQRIMFTLQVF
jgi:hypothetical protein